MKGMAATPNYVYEKKKIIKQFRNDNQLLNNALKKFEKKFLLEGNVEYILMSQASKIHYSRKFKTDAENDLLEKCIKDISEYNMINSNKDFIAYYYLVKTENYLQNTNVCKGI